MKAFFSQKSTRSKADIPLFMMEIVRKYFRLEVVGLENIPKHGRALITPNHSGVTALDAVMIAHEVFKQKKRIPRMLAHPLWFVGPNIKVLAKSLGLDEADKDTGSRLLKKGNIVVLFPEGAEGNFKPTAERYHLQEFKRGFVRMAMSAKSPIIPTVVIGAEEANINLSSISVTKYLKGTVIPIPLNVLPLPSKWKIIFLPPYDMSKYSAKDAADKELVHRVANEIREMIQSRINAELKRREWIYFPPIASKKKVKKK